MSFQSPDSRKEQFRKYLESTGVVDTLTKVLVALYEEPERPGNPIEYIKQYLGAPTSDEHDRERAELGALRSENESLKAQLDALKARGDGAGEGQSQAEEDSTA